MKRFVVFLLLVCGTVMLTCESHQHHLEEEWQDFLEASEMPPEKAAVRKIIAGAPWGIKPFAGWKSHWKFQRCPLGMKRVNLGMCRPVWE
jgi:hypothetical protein